MYLIKNLKNKVIDFEDHLLFSFLTVFYIVYIKKSKNMFRDYLIIFSLLSLVFISCSEEQENQENTVVEVVEPVVETPNYPRLPAEFVTALLQQADALEGTFYNSGKSISLWDDNVKSVLAMMTEPAPKVLEDNVVGHIMYLKDGEKLAYVEISLNDL